jgi:hypothetical protein
MFLCVLLLLLLLQAGNASRETRLLRVVNHKNITQYYDRYFPVHVCTVDGVRNVDHVVLSCTVPSMFAKLIYLLQSIAVVCADWCCVVLTMLVVHLTARPLHLPLPLISFITRDYGESPKLNIVMEYVDHGTYPLPLPYPPRSLAPFTPS